MHLEISQPHTPAQVCVTTHKYKSVLYFQETRCESPDKISINRMSILLY